MTPITHNPNCAVVRTGDIRAWCDCGAALLLETERNQWISIGEQRERRRIIAWLQERDGLNDFYSVLHRKRLSERIEEKEHLK